MPEAQIKNYYEILGVSKQASPDEITGSYRKMSKECHPDKNREDPDAKEKFIKLNEAHKVLSDLKKRKLYDMYQHNEFIKLQEKFADNVFREIRRFCGQENYYDILKIDEDASPETIKVTYKQTLRSLHHFKTKNSKEMIKKTDEVYKVLSNPKKRNLYDTLGHKEFVASYCKKDILFTDNFKVATKVVN